jgi:hypothetical protein
MSGKEVDMSDHDTDIGEEGLAGQPPLNREQRRAQERGKDPLADQPDPGTTRDAAFKGGNAELGSLSGAGTGGATESDDRLTHHEGMHLGNDPNS